MDPERYARDLARVSQEVLHLAVVPGVRLDITVEVQADAQPGSPTTGSGSLPRTHALSKFTHAAFELLE